MRVLVLTNPNGTLVKAAKLFDFSGGQRRGSFYLMVESIYRNSSYGFTSELAAKQYMGRNYQTGCKWKEQT